MTYQENLPPNFFETEVARVHEAQAAQAIVLPNNFRVPLTENVQAHIAHYAALGERVGTPVVVFSLGDLADRISFDPRVWVLRYSLYKHSASARDISMPNVVAHDWGAAPAVRTKNAKPRVSFCGLALPPAGLARLKYHAKNTWYQLGALAHPALRARKSGIYWRRRALDACANSSLLETNFIIRSTFSGNSKTIERDPTIVRREFISSIADADFVLAPKGDGNFSNRFLEALALGRIPVLIDTDVVLPLESVIDYSKITVRVPMGEVQKTSEYTRAFYDSLSNEEWQARQRLARATFEKYLRQDAFLRHFFTTVL